MEVDLKVQFLFLLAFLAFAANAAFTIDPPQISLRTSMGENMAWVEVRHTGGGPMAVDLAVYPRDLDMDGEPVRELGAPAAEFTVYPAQIILQPGDRARVQVLYKGKKVGADKAYVLYSREVPLRIDEESEGVKVGVETVTSYFSVVAFETGKPGKLTFVSSKQIGGGNIEVVVENKSAGRVPVTNLVLNISGRDRITSFTGKKNSVMPGQQRRFTFKYDKALTAREVTFVR
jgi:P pilus assembly chaperone PapD